MVCLDSNVRRSYCEPTCLDNGTGNDVEYRNGVTGICTMTRVGHESPKVPSLCRSGAVKAIELLDAVITALYCRDHNANKTALLER
jgi:hypothetical protein